MTVEIGQRVEVVGGRWDGLRGTICEILEDEYDSPVELKIKIKKNRTKRFHWSEVRLLDD